MGNDLYWKKTPKPTQEETHGISYATWGRLSTIWDKDMNDMSGIELDKTDIPELRMIQRTASAIGGESEFETEINEIIEGIKKFDSITFIIRG
jgi:hypothetical protein